MILGIFLNCVVMMCLWRSSQLRKKLCYFMMLVLSFFDLIVVGITSPMVLSGIISIAFHTYNALPLNVAALILNVAHGFSIFALLTLNFERFLSITKPIFHRTYVTKRRLLYTMAFLQLQTIILSTICFEELLMPDYVAVFILLVAMLSLFVYLNYKMFLVARKQYVSPAVQQKRRRLKLEFKKAFTCSLAVLCFMLCSLPGIVICGLCMAWKKTLYDDRVVHITMWVPTVSSINSTCNCLILFWRNAVLRHEGMKLLKCFKYAKTR